MNSQIAIETKNLVRNFGNIKAVSKLNMKVREGKIHGFVGPNGAGKTTTIKMLIGAVKPSRGTGAIKGQKIGSREARKIIGYAPEFPSFYSDMKAFDYLIYMARLSGISHKEACKRGINLLDSLGLIDFRNKKVAKFSAGMKKKMALAQAMIHKPEILILDEPTANLDPTARMNVIDTLKKQVSEYNLTVLVSSHILTELEILVDDVTLINKGEIVLQGEIDDIRKEFNKGRFVLNTSNDLRMNELLKEYTWISDIHEYEKGGLFIVTDKVEMLKKELVSILHKESILLNHFNRETISLDNIYKTMIQD